MDTHAWIGFTLFIPLFVVDNKTIRSSRERTARWLAKQKIAKRTQVRGPVIARIIWGKSRVENKLRGLENSLTKEIIEQLISSPCKYCGENFIKMSLDRIDNTLGYIIHNVIPACLRCNNMRGDMPYYLWIHMVPKIKEMREKGLFSEWDFNKRFARMS